MSAATTPDRTRAALLARFPWLTRPYQTMVIGCDLDALLSAAFLHHYFGWQAVGVYNLRTIYAAEAASDADLKAAVWVDLDIARADIRSIGHHVLTATPRDDFPEHVQSLNPNLVRGMSAQNFRRKFPLSTHHLLLWLTGLPAPGRPCDPYLLWLPDSCWITAQFEERYLPNAREWIQNWMPHPFLVETIEQCKTQQYEENMRVFLSNFAARVPLPAGQGQTRSRWFHLTGHQTRYDDPITQNDAVQQTLDHLARLLDWRPLVLPRTWRTIRSAANRHRTALSDFKRGEHVFSWAIPNAGLVNYTLFDNF